jgi:glutamine---fructose-6-phosphate transaminase (isomerizing)
MCGVFGFVGQEQSVTTSVGVALKSLEYRGYDSWGIVWRDGESLRTEKHTGRVPTQFTFDAVSRIAVGHTRWATHGGVTDANAHPHLDATGRVAIVHNGIVENAASLKSLVPATVQFQSETDSEVIAHLLGIEVRRGHPIAEALRRIFPLLEGQNAVVAIDQQDELIAAAMNVSPLVIGMGANGSCIASDPFALAGRAETMIVAPRGAVVELSAIGVRAWSLDGRELPLPDAHPVPDVPADEMGPYSSFMAREMSEQPAVLRWQADDAASVTAFSNLMNKSETVIFTGCGSAFYAARLGAGWIGRYARRRAIAIQASELAEAGALLGQNTLVCAVTQSGETADVLEAMEFARHGGASLVALTNVEHSSAARLADLVVPLGAGRERSVLATKSMTAMLGRMLTLSLHCDETHSTTVTDLTKAANMIEKLDISPAFHEFIEAAAITIAGGEHCYVIGRGDGAGVAQEAALKIKEASYIHAEAFAAGELKHGAIALIEPGSPCLLFTADVRQSRDTASATQEVRSRGGYTIGVGPGFEQVADVWLSLDDIGPALVIVEVFVAQSLALELAQRRQVDPDYPRNLAKSVTVK